MAKKKKKAKLEVEGTKVADNLFEAVVEFKYGKGKKAQSVKLPVTVDFSTLYVSPWETETEGLENEAVDKACLIDLTNKVLNMKELRAAYKAWCKANPGA